VAQSIQEASSGKLPNVAQVTTSVMNDILPQMPALIASAKAGGGNTAVASVAGQTLTAVSASLSSTVNYDPEKDFTVTAIDNGNSARITKYNGKNTEIKIPPRIENRPQYGNISAPGAS